MCNTHEGNFLFLGNSRSGSSEVSGVKSKWNVLNLGSLGVGGCRIGVSIDQQVEVFGVMTLIDASIPSLSSVGEQSSPRQSASGIKLLLE